MVAYFDDWIMVKGGVVTAQSPSVSDVRAKQVIGQSDSGDDLETLQQIKVTDFRWIDRSLSGDVVHKKVIAQEVKEIYPEAISYVENVIPSVYENATDFSYQIDVQLLTITTEKPHGFMADDLIDIYLNDADLNKISIEQLVSDHTFVISCDHEPKGVFVYGKWVNDFHVVDYDAISMLNVSATQELSRHVTALQAENAELKAELQELRQLQTEMALIKTLLRNQAQPTIKKTSLH